MCWNIDFEICALIILGVVVALHISKQYVSIRRSHLFLAMVAVECVAILCNIGLRQMLIYHGISIGTAGIALVDFYIAVQYALPLLFMYYMVVWSGKSMIYGHNQWAFILFWLPIVGYAFVIGNNIAKAE